MPGNWDELGYALWILVASNVSLELKQRAKELGKELSPDDVDPVSWDAVAFSQTLKVEDYPWALRKIHQQSRRMAEFHSRFDIVMSPTLGQVPVRLGVQRTDNPDIEEYRRALAEFSPFTQMFNITGQPSMSVPLHWNPDDLPVGVMFSAAYGDEATLFRLASQLEVSKPWFSHTPPPSRLTHV